MWAVALLMIATSGWAAGAEILAFFPFGGTSHHILFKPWITSLCQRGHRVTYLSANQFQENLTNLEKIPFPHTWDRHIADASKEWTKSYMPDSVFRMYCYLYEAMIRVGRDALRHPAVKSILYSNRKYDAVITEAYFYSEWTSVFAHRFQATHIVVQTFGDYAWANEMAGLPDNPSYVVDHQFHKAQPTSILDRLFCAWTTFSTIMAGYYFTSTAQQKMVDELVRYPGWEDRPRLTQLASDVALILRNTHHSMGHPLSAAPHVKDVGGLNIEFLVTKRTNALISKEFDEFRNFMDDSPNGFVYFSMGTQVKPWLLPNGTFEVLYSAFSRLDFNVLMRWVNPKDSPRIASPNIKLCYGFLPQMDILGHKNIKLFVTHGGLLGMTEAIYFGVPILGLPVFSDQPMNVMKASSLGYGLYFSNLRRHPLVENEVVTATKELLRNPKYKREAAKRSELFKDRIMAPVEEAVYWTEYVIKHGKVLQPAAARLNFYQLYLLDAFAVMCFSAFVSVWIVKKAAKIVLSWSVDLRQH